MGKHSAENTRSRRRHRKALFLFDVSTMLIMFLVLLILGYILFMNSFIQILAEPNKESIDKSSTVESPAFMDSTNKIGNTFNAGIVNITENANIESSNSLIIQEFKVDNTNPNYPKISGKVFNPTSNFQNNLSIDITLYDESKTAIATLNFTFEEIAANDSKPFFSVQTNDLSNCSYYSAKIQ